MPLQMDEDGFLVHVPTGQLANNNAAACGCCEGGPGGACCVRDPGIFLYLTVDNYEIDFPVRSIYSPFGVDDSLCTVFPDIAELEGMALNAISSTTIPTTSIWSWSYGVGSAPAFPAPSILVPGHGSTPLVQAVSMNLVFNCRQVEGLYRWQIGNSLFGGQGFIFSKMSNPGFPWAWQRVYCIPRYDLGFPDLGLVSGCEPLDFEITVECYFGKFSSFFTPNDGHCRTTGRVRLRITE